MDSNKAPKKKSVMPVMGMSCANCALSIESKLRKLPGIDLAAVNLAEESLRVDFDPALVDEKKIIAGVIALGYGVPVGKGEFLILGLQEASDARALEKALAAVEGSFRRPSALARRGPSSSSFRG